MEKLLTQQSKHCSAPKIFAKPHRSSRAATATRGKRQISPHINLGGPKKDQNDISEHFRLGQRRVPPLGRAHASTCTFTYTPTYVYRRVRGWERSLGLGPELHADFGNFGLAADVHRVILELVCAAPSLSLRAGCCCYSLPLSLPERPAAVERRTYVHTVVAAAPRSVYCGLCSRAPAEAPVPPPPPPLGFVCVCVCVSLLLLSSAELVALPASQPGRSRQAACLPPPHLNF